jgi:predicted Ser/Thr protein kinase
VPDPVASTSDSELRAHVERALHAHYDLDREIGRGGMGIVYRARDRRLKRTVAVKLLPPELSYRSEIRTRFLREAETAAQLSHPNIVPIYAVDEVDNLVFFVMAYVDGVNLATRLHEQGRLGIEETRRIVREVADALAFAHQRKVIHRDIKPDNILLDRETGRAMVTDFGIARAISEGADSRLTATGMAIGTPAYMSPEQAAGDREIDGRSDLYSLGVVAYQMLTGSPPFIAASTPAMLVKHLTERPVPLEQCRADVPTDLGRAIMMLLEKEPANRFPSAAALTVALDNGVVPALPAAPATSGVARPSTGAPYASPVPAPLSPAPLAAEGAYAPTAEERKRWSARPVLDFRRKLAPYLAVNAVIVIATIIGRDTGFLTLTMMWTMYMAYRYARLWSDGYDWRDIFRQPRDKELIDVAGEAIDTAQGLLDKNKRKQLRERSRLRRVASRSTETAGDAASEADLLAQAGPHAAKVRQAALDRDQIVNLVETMPKAERDSIPDVVPSALALYDRVRALAITLADIERNLTPGAAERVEAEITALEAAANPLDRVASEERVRRLAFLKRERRAVADYVQRRAQAASKLESCALALQNMRFDILRLRASPQLPERMTSLALQALSLAREVDYAVSAADQVSRVTSRRSDRRSDGRAAPDVV